MLHAASEGIASSRGMRASRIAYACARTSALRLATAGSVVAPGVLSMDSRLDITRGEAQAQQSKRRHGERG